MAQADGGEQDVPPPPLPPPPLPPSADVVPVTCLQGVAWQWGDIGPGHICAFVGGPTSSEVNAHVDNIPVLSCTCGYRAMGCEPCPPPPIDC